MTIGFLDKDAYNRDVKVCLLFVEEVRCVSKDVTGILAGWAFDPRDYTVRIVTGDDGQDKIQIRLDLGLLQMNFHGRPDGQQPHGYESYLHYVQQQQRQHDAHHADGPPYQLNSTDSEILLREGIQYYHRYLSFWHLKLYELCARDTKRNLELFAFVREYAKSQQEKMQFDQYRPYVTMMHARAVATPLAELRQYDAALHVIESGITGIEAFLQEYEQSHRSQHCFELQFLKRWQAELEHKKSYKPPPPLASATLPEGEEEPIEPTDETSETEVAAQAFPLENAKKKRSKKLSPEDVLAGLREQLQRAIAEERYEEAARLRDQISEQQRTDNKN
jgi:hypothetical protein